MPTVIRQNPLKQGLTRSGSTFRYARVRLPNVKNRSFGDCPVSHDSQQIRADAIDSTNRARQVGWITGRRTRFQTSQRSGFWATCGGLSGGSRGCQPVHGTNAG